MPGRAPGSSARCTSAHRQLLHLLPVSAASPGPARRSRRRWARDARARSATPRATAGDRLRRTDREECKGPPASTRCSSAKATLRPPLSPAQALQELKQLMASSPNGQPDEETSKWFLRDRWAPPARRAGRAAGRRPGPAAEQHWRPSARMGALVRGLEASWRLQACQSGVAACTKAQLVPAVATPACCERLRARACAAGR
jgi:hypothetical protein